MTGCGLQIKGGCPAAIESLASASGVGPWLLNGTSAYYDGGAVGIGTSAPASKLEINSHVAAPTESPQLIINTGGATNGGLLIQGAPSQSNDLLDFQDSSGALLAYVTYDGLINTADGDEVNPPYDFKNNYYGMGMFRAGADLLGFSTSSLERVRIDNNGNVGIGTKTPGWRLQVGASGDGTIAVANSWNTFSDLRLKRDLEKISDACRKVDQLNGYYYYWKTGADHSRQVGVIAQEVEQVLPELVKTGADGIKTVDYLKLSALLIESSKEQNRESLNMKARLSGLQDKAASLEAENVALKARLDRIEKLLSGVRNAGQ